MRESNLLKNKFPELLNEWNYNSNKTLKPDKLTYGSNLKVWWICKEGHEWEATVKNRTKGRGCPFCAGKKASMYNCLEFLYPEVAKEWHPTKNKGTSPKQVTSRTLKKAWWICREGHEWEASISNRTNGGKCPICNIDKLVNTKKRWFKSSLELVDEWHPIKNGDLRPEHISLSFKKLVWWKCKECDFEWEAKVSSRYNGHHKCLQCNPRLNKAWLPGGKKSLELSNPKLAKEWHPIKNGNITPDKISAYTNKKYWWRCSTCDEEWEAQVSNRQINSNGEKGCPFCAGKKVGKNNSLQSKYPQLISEWDFVKNKELSPEKIYYSTLQKVWWKCNKGHEWEESVRLRVVGSKNLEVLGCPFCSGHRIAEDNCLSTINPKLAREWHPTKNKLTPKEVTKGSHKLVWWLCPKGHEWKATVSKRSHGRGCPKCNPKTSFPEQAIFYYLSKSFPNIENRFSSEDRTSGYEIDIFLKDFNIGIEYDGYFYHKDKKNADENKSISLARDEILLIRVREEGLPSLDNVKDLVYMCKGGSEKSLEEVIEQILLFISNNYFPIEMSSIKVDIQNDKNEILSNYYFIQEKESIFCTHPNIMNLWNWNKNIVSPKNLSYGSGIKVWWVCSKGHEWKATVSKIIQGQNCPYCSNKKVYHSILDNNIQLGNSLVNRFPEIAKEWHPYKNGDLKPEEVVFGSHKRVWWRCIKGHEWENTVAHRTKRGQGCGICSGRGKGIVTINEVKELFRQENCMLLEKDYINSTTKMKYQCSCGNESYITFSKFKQGQRCKRCVKERLKN